MRLWHYKLIEYLPNSQLLAQWRELNSIFKKQDRHILINYIYEYPKDDLRIYSKIVMLEMKNRGFRVSNQSLANYLNYLQKPFDGDLEEYHPFKSHHNNRYLLQCFYNLQEKFDRGQKDFSIEQYKKLENFMKSVYKD